MSKHKEQRAARNARTGKYKVQARRTSQNKLDACKRHVAKHPNDGRGKEQLRRRLDGDI